MKAKKKIFITFQTFLPAFKAGGPVQSIANICRQLCNEYEFYILCNNTEYKDPTLLKGVKYDEWNQFEGDTAKVFYISSTKMKARNILRLLHNVKPDIVYINGIFSPSFSIVPLFYTKSRKIISIRGMVHPGALTQKSFKKKIFLSLLKIFGIHKQAFFHATDKIEAQYVKRTFGNRTKVLIAQNFPNLIKYKRCNSKQCGVLKLVSIALISPVKNHALVLKALQRVKAEVNYDIYGPIKDEAYWNKCSKIIEILPSNVTVNYKGSIEPVKVPQTLTCYDSFILLSNSENFGHAIFESLNTGIPVITSHFTPWNDLEKHKAGWNVDINNQLSITSAIETAAMLDEASFQEWSRGAEVFAKKSINAEEIKEQYRRLFY